MQTDIAPDTVALIVAESGLSAQKGRAITEQFSDFLSLADEWQAKAVALTVTDESQKAEMKMAREGRLFLREKRLAVEKVRVALKADALAEGRAIDAVAKALTSRLEPIEKLLGEAETFAVRAQAARDAALTAQRTALIAPYQSDTSFYDFARMPQANFDALLNSCKHVEAARRDAAKLVEAERLAAEQVRAAQHVAAAQQQALVLAENKRLHQEAAEREAILVAERAAAEERRIEVELDAAEQRLVAGAQAEAAKRAAAAPDKVKLLALADTLAALPLPMLDSADAALVLTNVKTLLAKVDSFLRAKANEL